MVPVVEGSPACLPDYVADMRGLLLVEGEDIEPKHFKATRENYKHIEKTHPLKDEIEIALIRHALRKKLPILGICRGSQLLNVVCGGTLYGDVQKEKKSRLKHIDFAHYDSYRHPISIVPGSPLQNWYARKTLRVNSYHHQGIRDLAPRFQPMAYSKDGLIEGYYDPKGKFCNRAPISPRAHAGGTRRKLAHLEGVRRRRPSRETRISPSINLRSPAGGLF